MNKIKNEIYRVGKALRESKAVLVIATKFERAYDNN